MISNDLSTFIRENIISPDTTVTGVVK